MIPRRRFLNKDVQCGSCQAARPQRFGQSDFVNNAAARAVDNARSTSQGSKLLGTNHAACFVSQSGMNRQKIRASQELMKIGNSFDTQLRRPLGCKEWIE